MPTKTQIRDAKQRLPLTKHSSEPGVPLPVLRMSRTALPCTNLGEHQGETAACPSCAGTVTLKVFPCSVHGRATVSRVAPGVPGCCLTCDDYQVNPDRLNPLPPLSLKREYGPIGKKHLLYHVLPVSGNGVWRKGVDHLRLRWGLFTGRKIVSVAVGDPVQERVDPSERVSGRPRVLSLDSPAQVRRYLPPDCEVVEVPNDPHLWELVSWPHLWGRLFETAGPDDAVLYCHAKGATRKITSSCHVWTDLLYNLALDHPRLVDQALRTRPLVGSLVKWGPYFGGVLAGCQWHYSGNFWWGRVGVVRERLAQVPVPRDRWAPEAWVGIAFHPTEAGQVYSPRFAVSHLYSPAEMERVVADYDRWLSLNPPTPSAPDPIREPTRAH